MEERSKLHPAIRFPVAFGFAFLAAWLVRNLAEPVWFLKLSVVGPFPYFDAPVVAQIILTLVLIFPAYYVADWLLKSRIQTILISFAALIAVLWLASSDW